MTTSLESLWQVASDPARPLLADSDITQIMVHDCGESLTDAAGHLPVLPFVGQRPGLPPASTWLREGVLERLVRASDRLGDVSIAVVEGFRTTGRQQLEFDAVRESLRASHPTWSCAQLDRQAAEFVAPPSRLAPHLSGGAVDLTLVDSHGFGLDMGSPVNALGEESKGACYTGFPLVSPEVRDRRAALVEALVSEGFVNYPSEWWHWSLGDQYWAFVTGASCAVYGPVVDPSDGPEDLDVARRATSTPTHSPKTQSRIASRTRPSTL